MRVGIGYDVHAFSENRDLILGGVKIPYELGLNGHSDADVLTHAIMDALLGAAGLSDIGQQFPDTDDRYLGISSLLLLEKVGMKIRERGYEIGNLDTILILQKPKVAPYLAEMRRRISEALKTDEGKVNIKATTEEHLGFTGEGKGVKAQAVVLLEEKK